MRALHIPKELQEEFATVVAVWESGGATMAVDSLLLTWVKYEKQLRRLFSFLVFQHPEVNKKTVQEIVNILAKCSKLNPVTITQAINALNAGTVEEFVGESYSKLSLEIARIKLMRNKLMHGQLTGKNVAAKQIQIDVHLLIEWVAALAAGAKNKIGYDGFSRNTFRKAKEVISIQVAEYPFSTPDEFGTWLRKAVK